MIKFVYFPSLKPVSNHKTIHNKILNTYKQYCNPKCLMETKLKSSKFRINKKCSLLVAPFVGFLEYQELIVLVVTTDIDKNSEILKYLNENIFF